jgi:N-carbamoyl-L-amino-acid hydrolase
MTSPIKLQLAANAAMTEKDLAELSARVFDDLRQLTGDGIGISRATYGDGESAAMEYMARLAESEGLSVRRDAAANLVIEVPGKDPDAPCIVCGSHLDSVPQGGNYDGAAGVLAALLALIRLKRAGVVPPRTVRAMALRGEESAWFGVCYLGSSALFGQLAADDMARPHRDTGKALRDYMAEAGAAADRIAAGDRLIDPASIAAYLELHIEQGPVMVARGFPVAVVTGLRGNIRHQRVTCRGEAGHAGAVPRWLRKDAVLATADLLTRYDENWRALNERGVDLVVTAGIISTNPADHAMSRIPGECSFSIEIRSQSIDTLETFYQLMRSEAESVGRERGVRFEFDRRSLTRPAMMNDRWIAHLLDVCGRLGLPQEKLASGAGHDAAVFANAGVPSAMIFVRNDHGSHNPQEAMELGDFLKGADVLYNALLEPPL